ncbi:MAG: hypothetical protein H3C35_06410 [Bacteroidetes bacterium]|nr:hypothetical protein [Bacteroidota bacterium]
MIDIIISTHFRKLAHLFVSLFLPILLFSQPVIYENGNPSRADITGHTSVTRSIIDLAGEWEYSLNDGVAWMPIVIPSAMEYEGKIIFRRKFEISEELAETKNFELNAYGINYSAEIYINETYVGKHEGGYTSFSISVPENIIQVGKENIIRIVVNSALNFSSTLPVRQQVFGWKNYAGIFRDIFLVATPRVWIDNAVIKIEGIDPKTVTLGIHTVVSAKKLSSDSSLIGKSFVISAEAIELSTGSTANKILYSSVSPEDNRDIEQSFSISITNPKLWSPDSPELYLIKISISHQEGKTYSLVDQFSVTTGLRTIVKNNNQLLLNGVPQELNGVVWIEDSYSRGSSISYEEMERDVALIKNLGANAVRVGFHPPHPYFIQLCNKYGLFVFEELPLFEIPAAIALKENYTVLAKNYLKEMIQRDVNNPSVIAWGLGEGMGETGKGHNALIKELHESAKSLDDRLTYYIGRVPKSVEAESFTDIIGISIFGNTLNAFQSRLKELKRTHPEQILIAAGYGKEAELNNHGGYNDPFSQENQARYVLQHYTAVKESKISGGFVWAFNDWRSARPILRVPLEDHTVQSFGMVELDRKKKTTYDIIRSAYHGEKVTALPAGTYVHPLPYVYVVSGLALLILFAWFLNNSRRFQESVVRGLVRTHNFYSDIRDQQLLPLGYTVFLSFIISLTIGIVLSSIFYHYRANAILDYALSLGVINFLKGILIQMAWNPLLCILYIAAFMLLWFLAVTVLIKLLSYMVKVRIFISHAYTIAVWPALPYILYLLVAMILYRIMESDPYVIPVLISIAILTLWIFIRTLKGISVLFVIYPTKVYMVGTIIVIILLAGLYGALDYTRSFSIYGRYFIDSIVPFLN